MYSTTLLAALLSTGTHLLVSAQESSQIPIPFATGADAVTAAPPVPTFSISPSSAHADIVAAAALGDSNVVNKCSFNVYLYVCNQQGCGGETTVTPGAEWSQQLSSSVNDGVSIKIGTTSGEQQKPILQLEYTNDGSNVWFDASEINGNPFGNYGYWMGDSQGLYEYCAPPCTSCSFVYYSGEDGTVFVAPNTGSIGLTLCSSS